MEDFTIEINGRTLEFFDDGHIYLCDGVEVCSVSRMLRWKFGHKYDFVDKETLRRSAEQGTAVHEAIENYCKSGAESDLPELRGFKFLQKTYGFEVIGNEEPVILCRDDVPIAVGRFDMLMRMNGQVGLADIKRTYSLDKEHLTLQLNIYRLAYQQTYGTEIQFLRGIHLREDVRKFVTLPINESATWDYINAYLEANNE